MRKFVKIIDEVSVKVIPIGGSATWAGQDRGQFGSVHVNDPKWLSVLDFVHTIIANVSFLTSHAIVFRKL